MLTRRELALLVTVGAMARGQEVPVDFICPMDPDVRSKGPGKCPRCGMRLEAGLPEPIEYPDPSPCEAAVPTLAPTRPRPSPV